MTGIKAWPVVLTALAVGLSMSARAEDAAVPPELSCLIEPNQTVKLRSEATGALAWIKVRRGDRVKAGEELAALESGVERAQYEAARLKAATKAYTDEKKAVAEAASLALDRKQKLASKEMSSLQDLDKAKMEFAVAQAQLEAAELDRKLTAIEAERLAAQLARRTLRAPVSGLVTSVEAHAGELADGSATILTLAETDPLKVEVYLPLSAFPSIRVGQKAVIRPEKPINGRYEALVVSKDAHIDAASSLFQVRLDLPNADGSIPSGIRCEAHFEP